MNSYTSITNPSPFVAYIIRFRCFEMFTINVYPGNYLANFSTFQQSFSNRAKPAHITDSLKSNYSHNLYAQPRTRRSSQGEGSGIQKIWKIRANAKLSQNALALSPPNRTVPPSHPAFPIPACVCLFVCCGCPPVRPYNICPSFESQMRVKRRNLLLSRPTD